MSAIQERVLQNQARSRIEQIREEVAALGLSEALLVLPSYQHYNFTVRHDDNVIDFGNVYPSCAPNNFNVALHPAAHLIYDSSEQQMLPSYEVIAGMDHQERVAKGVFAWHQVLYDGLFQEHMDRRSAALLQYVFLQWKDESGWLVDEFPDDRSQVVDVAALCQGLELVQETEQYQEYVRNKAANSDAEVSSSQYPMDSDVTTRHSMDKASGTAIQKIQRKIPDVKTTLPSLQDLNLTFAEHEMDPKTYLPLRLHIGWWSKDPQCKVWMYMLATTGAKRPVPRCEVQLSGNPNSLTRPSPIQMGSARDLDRVEFVDALKFCKGRKGNQGFNYLPITMLTQYYFLLRYKQEGIDLLPKDDVTVNSTYRKYLVTAINAYARSQGLPTVKCEPRNKVKGKGKGKSKSTPQGAIPDQQLQQPTGEFSATRTTRRSTKTKEMSYAEPDSDADADIETTSDPEDEYHDPLTTKPTTFTNLSTLQRTQLRSHKHALEHNLSNSLTSIKQATRTWSLARDTAVEVSPALYEAHPGLRQAEERLEGVLEEMLGFVERLEEVEGLLLGDGSGGGDREEGEGQEE